MTFVGMSLVGAGAMLIWAAVTGENPVRAAADVLRGRPPGDHPIDLSEADEDPETARRFRGDPLPPPDDDADGMAPIREVV